MQKNKLQKALSDTYVISDVNDDASAKIIPEGGFDVEQSNSSNSLIKSLVLKFNRQPTGSYHEVTGNTICPYRSPQEIFDRKN